MFIFRVLLALANRGMQLKGGNGLVVVVLCVSWCGGLGAEEMSHKKIKRCLSLEQRVTRWFMHLRAVVTSSPVSHWGEKTTTPNHLLCRLYSGPQDTTVSEEARIVKPSFFSSLEQTWDQHFLSCGRWCSSALSDDWSTAEPPAAATRP